MNRLPATAPDSQLTTRRLALQIYRVNDYSVHPMRFARWAFGIAGIYGLALLLPM